MIKNFKLFFNSLLIVTIFYKAFVLFIIGIFSRFIINNLIDCSFVELIYMLFMPLYIGQFDGLKPTYSKFFNNNLNYFKTPKDKTIYENTANEDCGIKDRFRRKCHWFFLEQFNSEFKNYQDFKNWWDPDKKYNILLKNEYRNKKYTIKLYKNTFSYFLHGRKRP